MRLYLADVKIFPWLTSSFQFSKNAFASTDALILFQPWRLCAQWESIRSSHSVECADMSHRMTDSNKPRKRYIYASTYLSFLLSFFLFSSLSIYRSTDGSLDLFACLSIYLSILLIFHLGWSPKRHPQVPKSFIKFRENTVFWRLAGAFFGEPT